MPTLPQARPTTGDASEPTAAALPGVLREHALEAVHLRLQRGVLVRAPHVTLGLLERHDQRIAAHLDGLATAGPAGVSALAEQAAEDGADDVGAVFAPAALSLLRRDQRAWQALLAPLAPADMAAATPRWRGLLSALGWVSSGDLRGVVQLLLAAAVPAQQALGLACCRLHRVDPGDALADALAHADHGVRVQAWRTAGALRRTDLLARALAACRDAGAAQQAAAAAAACLLGEANVGPPAVAQQALDAVADGPEATTALDLLFAALPDAQAADWARAISARAAAAAAKPAAQRQRLSALARLGDPRFVPWLIEQMADPAQARGAGEALVWITGVELSTAGLESLVPRAGADAGDDDPASIDLDADDALPWPDAARVQAWWSQHGPDLLAAGAAAGGRLLAGRPRDAATAAHLLAHGTQRLRAHAALLQAVLQPQAPLLPVAAPAWRQRRWLAAG